MKIGAFFRPRGSFFRFFTQFKSCGFFVTFFFVFVVIFRGLGRMWAGILKVFFDDVGGYIEKRDIVKISVSLRREHDF